MTDHRKAFLLACVMLALSGVFAVVAAAEMHMALSIWAGVMSVVSGAAAFFAVFVGFLFMVAKMS